MFDASKTFDPDVVALIEQQKEDGIFGDGDGEKLNSKAGKNKCFESSSNIWLKIN